MTVPNTTVMRQCAEGHRKMAGMYALDPSEGAEVVADGCAVTALLLEQAADWIDAQTKPEKGTEGANVQEDNRARRHETQA